MNTEAEQRELGNQVAHRIEYISCNVFDVSIGPLVPVENANEKQ